MVRLLEQGKIRMAGVSNFEVPLLQRCKAIRHVDSLQPPFSLIRRQAAEREIPWCLEHKTGVICYSPMESGLLTDNVMAERVARLVPDDWRRRAPQFQEPDLSRNIALHAAFRPSRNGTRLLSPRLQRPGESPGLA
jgi:aryl-alcohol dehydrogenase-like predicted oxidoreductase